MATRGWQDVKAKDIAGMGRRTVAPSKAKYRNEKILINGQSFDSKREAQYYSELLMREKAGQVGDIKRQVIFPLYAVVLGADLRPVEPVELIRVTEYRADFTFNERTPYRPARTECTNPLGATVRFIVADVKGAPRSPERYLLKKRWMQAQYGIQIQEIR